MQKQLESVCRYYYPCSESRREASYRATLFEEFETANLLAPEKVLDAVEAHYLDAGWKRTRQLRKRQVTPVERFQWTYFRHIQGWTYPEIADHWNKFELSSAFVDKGNVEQRVRAILDLLGISRHT